MTRDQLVLALRAALQDVEPDRAAELVHDVGELPDAGLSPDHDGPAEQRLLDVIATAIRRVVPERAEVIIERLGRARAEAQLYGPFLPRMSGNFARTEAAGSSHVLLTEACPSCERSGGVHYEGSDVLEGDLEYVHLIHTEVQDRFLCSACGHTWFEHRFI